MIGARKMTLRHFKIFITVCDTMNMTAAAEKLFISQSAISQAVGELEKYYGVKLFERISRKLYLTKAGEKLSSYARHMIRMNRDIEADMKALRENGFIRLGASVTVGSTILPPLVANFLAQNAKTQIEVFEGNTEQVEKRLLSDRTDIGLVEGDIQSADIRTTPFLEDELVLICRKAHAFAKKRLIQPEELEREPFIIREQGSGTRKTFERVMAEHGLSWRAAWVCNNADTIKAAVAAGLGVSVISGRAVAAEAATGRLLVRPIAGMRFLRSFRIAYHKNKYLTEYMRSFMDFCVRS